MIINHNLASMNALSFLNNNNNALQDALAHLSSGKRINSAADDAAGLAISQKMQAQINGLDQATRNSQDGISMIQTAEGALNETQSILQRMSELATQAANGTNTTADRQSIQDEVNQLTDEINRIGNTTDFNTQSLLKGNGASNLNATGAVTAGTLLNGADASKTQAKVTALITGAGTAGQDSASVTLNGQTLTASFVANVGTQNSDTAMNVTATTAQINSASTETTSTSATGIANAFQAMIDANSTLKGQYTVKVTGGTTVEIDAVKGGEFDGAAASVSQVTLTKGGTGSLAGTTPAATAGTDVAATSASTTIDFTSYNSATKAAALVGQGFTVNGQEIQFYDATKGAYTGSAIGVNISGAQSGTDIVSDIVNTLGSTGVNGVSFAVNGTNTKLDIKATTAGQAGNSIAFSDGGVEKDFQATFQVGANENQSMTISIGDMRAAALGVSGTAGTSGFTATNVVTDGTTSTLREGALDLSTTDSATAAITTINKAITQVSDQRAQLGAYENRLQHTINNLSTASQNLTSASSRITDVDMAQEMSQFTKDNVLAQAATSMLAQANQQPQLVLKLLG